MAMGQLSWVKPFKEGMLQDNFSPMRQGWKAVSYLAALTSVALVLAFNVSLLFRWDGCWPEMALLVGAAVCLVFRKAMLLPTALLLEEQLWCLVWSVWFPEKHQKRMKKKRDIYKTTDKAIKCNHAWKEVWIISVYTESFK